MNARRVCFTGCLIVALLVCTVARGQGGDPQQLWMDVDTILNTVAGGAPPSTWGFDAFPNFRDRVAAEAARAGAQDFLGFFGNYPAAAWNDIFTEIASMNAAQKADLRSQILELGFSPAEADDLMAALESDDVGTLRDTTGTLFAGAADGLTEDDYRDLIRFSPAALAVKLANQRMLTDILTLAGTRLTGPMNPVSATLSAETWDFDNGPDGDTLGLTPAFARQFDNSRLTLAVPLYRISVDGADEDVYAYGLEGRIRHQLTERVAIGAHADGVNYHQQDAPDENVWTWTGGGFLSITVPVHEKVAFSVGTLLDYVDIEDQDDLWLGGVGANLGTLLAENLAVDLFGIWYADLDSDDNWDDNFVETGVQAATVVQDVWDVRLGVKTTLGYRDYEAYEAYVAVHRTF